MPPCPLHEPGSSPTTNADVFWTCSGRVLDVFGTRSGRLPDVFRSPNGRTEVITDVSEVKFCKQSHGNVRCCVAPQKPGENCPTKYFRCVFFRFAEVGALILLFGEFGAPICFWEVGEPIFFSGRLAHQFFHQFLVDEWTNCIS